MFPDGNQHQEIPTIFYLRPSMMEIDTNLAYLIIQAGLIVLFWYAVSRWISWKRCSARSSCRGRDDKPEPTKTLRRALILGVVWAGTYILIRRGLNPDVSSVYTYSDDAIYGGLAAFASTLVNDLVS